VSKDIVSWVWRKIKSDWDAWNARSLAAEPIVRLILDGIQEERAADQDENRRAADAGQQGSVA
jgi:hypothetical protein